MSRRLKITKKDIARLRDRLRSIYDAHVNYDAADNSRKCYDLAISTMRANLESFRCEMIGPHKLYLGDCRELLPLLPEVDGVVTDPPYDERTHSGAITNSESNGIDFAPLIDVAGLVESLLKQCRGWCVSFCPMEELAAYRDAAWPYKAWVRAGFWDRIVNTPQFSGDRPAQGGEGIAIFHRYAKKQWNGGGKAAIWRHMVERGDKQHPTQKPLRLISELVELFTEPRHLVLDPFMGSGTTGIACERLGRRFIGIEKIEAYFNVACRRIEEATKQSDLFIEPPKPEPAEQLNMLEAPQ